MLVYFQVPKPLPLLEKYWKAVKDDPSDFTGWTYLLQYVDQAVSGTITVLVAVLSFINRPFTCAERH